MMLFFYSNKTFKFIGGQAFSAAEHAQVGGVGQTNQILSSHHQHPQQRIPTGVKIEIQQH